MNKDEGVLLYGNWLEIFFYSNYMNNIFKLKSIYLDSILLLSNSYTYDM